MAAATIDELRARADAGDTAAMITLAESLEQRREHNEALALLSQAATAGNSHARALVGARLLVGFNAPHIPVEGARLITEAAQQGSGYGLSLTAVLLAAGAFVPQSWPAALDCLQRAAERGWQDAQNQLVTLSKDRILAERAQASAGRVSNIWLELRRSIDHTEWTTAPAGRTLNEAPLIRAFQDFASEQTCRWIIGRSQQRLVRAEIYNPSGVGSRQSETRTNTMAGFNLADTDLVQLALQARMAAAAGVAFAQMEAAVTLHYSVGEEFHDHYDFIDPKAPNYDQDMAVFGQRIVTFLVYLNEDYEGGETAFPRLGLSHKGKRGEGLFFTNALANGDPDLRALHAGRAPTRGEKWVVSQFIRNRVLVPGAARGQA